MRTALSLSRRDPSCGATVLYFHPWEFDPDQPELPLKRLNRFRTYVGIRRSRDRLCPAVGRSIASLARSTWPASSASAGRSWLGSVRHPDARGRQRLEAFEDGMSGPYLRFEEATRCQNEVNRDLHAK